MLGFVDTMNGSGAYALHDIVRIDDPRPNKHGVDLRKVIMRDGTSFDTFAHESAGLLIRPVQIIPAEPGTNMISVDVDASSGQLWRTPVIAWALCLDGETRPVTPNGVLDSTSSADGHYVEVPSGKIEAVGEYTDPCSFDHANDMIAYFAKRARSQDRKVADQQHVGWEADELALTQAVSAFMAIETSRDTVDPHAKDELQVATEIVEKALERYLNQAAPTWRHATRRLAVLSDNGLLGDQAVQVAMPDLIREARRLAEDAL